MTTNKQLNENNYRLTMLDIKENISVEMKVVKFPVSIIDIINQNNKSSKKNLTLFNLNNVVSATIPDVYVNYIKASTIEQGWIYSLTGKHLDEIKHFLMNWCSDNQISDETIYSIIESVKFEEETITITKDDLSLNGPNLNDCYLKRHLFLFYISNKIAPVLEYPLKTASKEMINLKFSIVNGKHSASSKHRLISDILEYKKTSKSKKKNSLTNKTFYYAYYIDLHIDTLYKESNPKLFINFGLVRFKTGLKKGGFATFNKNMRPYIKIPANMTADNNTPKILTGKILCKDYNNRPIPPKWDSLFTKCFEYLYRDLPKVDDILNNPDSYINNNDISIMIPHGTHFRLTTHEILQGMDITMRMEISNVILNAISSTIPQVFSDAFSVANKLGRIKSSENINLSKPMKLPNDDSNLHLEIYYTSESFKRECEQFIESYNKGIIYPKIEFQGRTKEIETEKKELKKRCGLAHLFKDIYSLTNPDEYKECATLKFNSNESIEVVKETINTFNKSINVNMKIIANFYHLEEDLKLNIVIEDKVRKVNNTKEKSKVPQQVLKDKAKKEISKLLDENKKALHKNIKKSHTVIPAIIEIYDAEFYKENNLVDIKSSLRHIFACENRVTQFCVSRPSNAHNNKKKKDEDDTGINNKLNSVFRECLRAIGCVIVDVNKPFENIIPNSKTAVIGVYIIPGTERFILTALFDGKVYGYCTMLSNSWEEISQLHTRMGNSIYNKKDHHAKEDDIEFALKKFNQQYMFDHMVVMINRSSAVRKIPYLIKMDGEFNLCIKSVDNINFKMKSIDKKLKDKISLVCIDEESNGLCPEWVDISKDGTENPTGLPGQACMFNDFVYFGMAPKTVASDMKSLAKRRKEEAMDSIMRKETAMLYTIPFCKDGYSTYIIARVTHSLRKDASIQHPSEECISLPYPLHMSKKATEYIISVDHNLGLKEIDDEDDCNYDDTESDDEIVIYEQLSLLSEDDIVF